MKRFFLPILLMVFSISSVFAASGIFDDAIKIQKNGGAETEYYFGIRCSNTSGGCVGSNSSTTSNFQGVNLGTGVTSLKIKWAEVRTYKNGISDITGANLFYRVYKAGDNPTATTEAIAFGANIGGGDQRWTESLNIELTTGLLNNTLYTLEIYSNATGSDGTIWNTNSGANFKLTFTTDAALAVNMRDLFVKKLDEESHLSWTTSSEKDNAQFNIQRSTNNQTWQTIGSVKATNNPSGAKYNFTDDAPLSSINYYRLQMVSTDGKMDYSKVVSVSGKEGKQTLSIYPNPVKAELNVLTDGTIEGISIYDMTGRMVRQYNDNRSKVNVQDLPNGIYFVRLLDKNGLIGEAVRFVKQ